jgi:hypothetical protein
VQYQLFDLKIFGLLSVIHPAIEPFLEFHFSTLPSNAITYRLTPESFPVQNQVTFHYRESAGIVADFLLPGDWLGAVPHG